MFLKKNVLPNFPSLVLAMRNHQKIDVVSLCILRSFVDFLKVLVFAYGHWITLIMVLVAGLGGTSLFALGYLFGAFIFLWKGNDLYLTDIRRVVRRWKLLLFYNVFAIICKVALQVHFCSEKCTNPALTFT